MINNKQKFGEKFLDNILFWIAHTYRPEEIFHIEDLEDWARRYGFVEQDSFRT